MFIFPELWLTDVVPYICFFFPWIIFFAHYYYKFWSRFPCADLELLGCPEWTRFSIYRAYILFLAYTSQLPHAQCSPTWEPSPAQVVVMCDPV